MTVQAESPDTSSELGFTGQPRLSAGLYVMGIRIYDAKLRQFLQPDLLNPTTYTYAGGDPINFVDPSGMVPVSLDGGGSSYSTYSGGYPGASPYPFGEEPDETIIVTGKKKDHGEYTNTGSIGGHPNVSEIPLPTRERAERALDRLRRDIMRGRHGTPPHLTLGTDPRGLTADEIRMAQRAFDARGWNGVVDFGAVVVAFVEGLFDATGFAGGSSPSDANVVFIDSAQEGAPTYGELLVHELAHVYIYQVVFDSNTAQYEAAHTLYYHTPSFRESPGFYDGIYEKIPWEAQAGFVADWCHSGRGDQCL
jgi:RHS repeat-associated protein